MNFADLTDDDLASFPDDDVRRLAATQREYARQRRERRIDELARQVRTATVIKPGDHVLLTTIEPFGQDLAKMRDALLERFPGVEFTFVAGVTDIAIDRQDEAEPEPPPDASWVSFGKPGTRFDHD